MKTIVCPTSCFAEVIYSTRRNLQYSLQAIDTTFRAREINVNQAIDQTLFRYSISNSTLKKIIIIIIIKENMLQFELSLSGRIN